MRVDLDEILTQEDAEPTWVVKDVIPGGTIILVAGDAGVGKSVMNFSEALHVALGRPFLGYPTVQSRVLYFDEENSRPDMRAYLRQLWVGMGEPDRSVLKEWLRFEHFSLGAHDWVQRMTAAAKEHQPGIIYVDTATSALAITEENDNSEAQRAVQGLRHVMRECGVAPAVKVLKHAKYQSGGGHAGTTRRTIRGAKAWLGAVDQTMYHIKAQGAPDKHGLHKTILVPDKRRAFGLRGVIHISPEFSETTPKSLILSGETRVPDKDLLIVPAG